MDRRRMKLLFSAIILLAGFLRLSYLGVFPPGREGALWLRLPTAVAGVASIGLLMLVVERISKNPVSSLVSGFMMTIMPWHIEQSRVYSQAMLGLFVLLTGTYAYLSAGKTMIKLIVVAVSGMFFYFAYPQFWIFTSNWKLPTADNYLANLFKLISVEFIFYKNDSFWSGGFRSLGAMLPSFIPLTAVGLFVVLQKLQSKHWYYFIPVFAVWLISAANPLFPEGREFFLITPYLALLTSFGVRKVIEQLKSANLIFKTLIIALFILISYEYVLFVHFYTIHYSRRIGNEIPHEELVF